MTWAYVRLEYAAANTIADLHCKVKPRLFNPDVQQGGVMLENDSRMN